MAATTPRRTLITGAASGIGLGLVHCLAAGGRPVVATDLDAAGLSALAGDCRERGLDVTTHPLDVSRDADVEAVVAALPGPVDILINNAGLQHVARVEEFPPDKWLQLIDVMLAGACRLTRALLPGMRRRGYGRIVNIGSIHGLVASPYKSAYVAAKHGLLGFAKVVALETADVDITINTICPSYVRTPLVDKQIEAQAASHGISPEEVIDTIMLKPMPKRRFISVEEIAATIEFLASDAARNITGQTIVIDGGWTAQ